MPEHHLPVTEAVVGFLWGRIHHITRQIVEALRAGKSGGIADLVASVEPGKTLSEAMKGNCNASKEKNSGSVSTAVYDDKPKKQKRDAEYWIARLKRDATTDPQAEALLGKAYRQASSDRKKPSTATLPLERGEVLAKGG